MTDADEHVLEPLPLARGVMDLVADHDRQAGGLRQLDEAGDEPVVVRGEVVGQLDEQVAVGKVPRPAFRGRAGRRPVAGEQVARHLAVATAGERHEMAARVVEGGLDDRALEDGELLLPGEVAARREP